MTQEHAGMLTQTMHKPIGTLIYYKINLLHKYTNRISQKEKEQIILICLCNVFSFQSTVDSSSSCLSCIKPGAILEPNF